MNYQQLLMKKHQRSLKYLNTLELKKIKPRPWVIEGWALKKTLTLVVGQPGVGKTMFLAQLGSGLASGNQY